MKKLFEAITLIGSIFGAILVAFSQNHPVYGILGYVFFMTGNLTAIWLLRQSNASKSLIVINIYFIIINIMGIATRIHW